MPDSASRSVLTPLPMTGAHRIRKPSNGQTGSWRDGRATPALRVDAAPRLRRPLGPYQSPRRTRYNTDGHEFDRLSYIRPSRHCGEVREAHARPPTQIAADDAFRGRATWSTTPRIPDRWSFPAAIAMARCTRLNTPAYAPRRAEIRYSLLIIIFICMGDRNPTRKTVSGFRPE